MEGGVAGSVNIITRKPLDFKKPLTMEASRHGASGFAEEDRSASQRFDQLEERRQYCGRAVPGIFEKRHLRRDGIEVLRYETIAPGSAIATARRIFPVSITPA